MTQHRKITKTAAETTLDEQFAALPEKSRGPERALAFAAFAAAGLPTRRDEAWHYTDLRAAMASAAPLAGAPSAERIARARARLRTIESVGDFRLAIVDGRHVPELSDSAPPGITIHPAASSMRGDAADAVVALNHAFGEDGLAILVETATDSVPRIEIVHDFAAETDLSVYSRIAITVRAGAKARIVERFIGASSRCQRNALTRLEVEAGAKADYVTIIADNPGLHLESQIVEIGEGAELNAFALIAGGGLARRQIFARHRQPSAVMKFSGLSLLDGKRHADTTLVIEHAAPRGQSREYFRHIVADEATGVFQGKVVVAPYAQKTDGGMKSQAILLSPGAVMNNKPELEIFADDVVCGHGATVGALDSEQIFYLQARGIPRAEAEAILLEAFGADAIDRVEDEEVAEFLRAASRAWLAARG
jgi:Fe-S cluster assembly protein SufD